MSQSLKDNILEIVPEATFEEGGQWLNVLIDSNNWLKLAEKLRTVDYFLFDYLFFDSRW